MKLYGNLPTGLGNVEVVDRNDRHSMAFILYLPIKLKGQFLTSLPISLRWVHPILDKVRKDQGNDWENKNVYLTVKTMYVCGTNTGQRPGWHTDGFMTDDINYLWFDSNSTQFLHLENNVKLTQDHTQSMSEMESLESVGGLYGYPPRTLLRLDETVIHRPSPHMKAGMRTFVKVSCSDHRYARKGNAINYAYPIYDVTQHWVYEDMSSERNCPASKP